MKGFSSVITRSTEGRCVIGPEYNYTVWRQFVHLYFSPEIVQAGAVKWLKKWEGVLCVSHHHHPKKTTTTKTINLKKNSELQRYGSTVQQHDQHDSTGGGERVQFDQSDFEVLHHLLPPAALDFVLRPRSEWLLWQDQLGHRGCTSSFCPQIIITVSANEQSRRRCPVTTAESH